MSDFFLVYKLVYLWESLQNPKRTSTSRVELMRGFAPSEPILTGLDPAVEYWVLRVILASIRPGAFQQRSVFRAAMDVRDYTMALGNVLGIRSP